MLEDSFVRRLLRRFPSLSVLAVFAMPLAAQTTWIVDAAGGPGVSFTTLPAAVAAAATGDTILVYPGPNGEGAASFQTDKGLTIVGVGGGVPIEPSTWPQVTTFSIGPLAAGSSFRMCGFTMYYPQGVVFGAADCDGALHFEDIETYNYTLAWSPFSFINCASVTMRDVYTTGGPTVWIDSSNVSLVSCTVVGNPCVQAWASTVDIVEPSFVPGWNSPVAIVCSDTDLRIAGDAQASIPTGNPVWPTATVFASGGTIRVDPAVSMLPGGMTVLGTAALTVGTVPASWLSAATSPGQTTSIIATAGPGAVVFQALGSPGPLVSTPLGLLGIDPVEAFAFYPPAVVPLAGAVQVALAIPPGIPLGLALASQSVVFDAGALVLGAPVVFLVQ